MNKHQLAEWLHDNYEQLAKANEWQTQETTRVKFEDLPEANKNTMLALADKMQGAFLIIASNVPVSGSLPPRHPFIDALVENTKCAARDEGIYFADSIRNNEERRNWFNKMIEAYQRQ